MFKQIIFTFLVFFSLVVKAQEIETLNVKLTDPSKPGVLKVNLISGSITVSGYNGKDVLIAASERSERENKKNTTRNGLRKIGSSGGYELTANERNNTVVISTDRPNKTVDIKVQVPYNFSLVLSAINNGDITIDNVIGNHEVSNINGFISAKNISGSMIANTINENVTVHFKSVKSGQPMALTSLNGDVDVTLPTSVKMDVKIKSEDGEIFSDFALDIKAVDKKPITSNNNTRGVYKIKKDGFTYATINGGGAELMMKSMNGDVIIRKLK
jgi:hypothetical protein